MNDPRIRKALRQADRLIELAPHYITHPSRVRQALRGLHPGTLPSIDQPWLRDFGIRTVLDVGANTGQFAQVAHYVFPDARIHAFEPLPSAYQAMMERMAGVEEFQAYQTAIGERDGTVTFHQSASSPSSSVLDMTSAHTEAFPWTQGETDIEVEIHRLDHYLPGLAIEPKLLLKIDVQGYSLPVLQGAQQTLDLADLVFVETSVTPLYEGEATFDQVYRHLAGAGFAFTGVLDQLTHPETGAILQMDAIFQRSRTRPS